MTSRLLRILLAFYLVLWTPPWCCCAVRGAIGAISGADAMVCRAAAVGDRAAPRACCLADRDRAPARGVPDVPCRCREIGRNQIRFDSSVKCALPPMVVLEIAAAPSDESAPGARCDRPIQPASARWDLPPPPTLLAQGCLLII